MINAPHGYCHNCSKPLERIEARDRSHQCRITSLAMLKRWVQVGTRIEVVRHWQPKYAGLVRTVTKAQGNGYWFDYNGKRCWADYPEKADRITFHDDGSFTIQYRDEDRATFRLLP